MEKSQLSIAVIIPAYNVAPYIGQAVQSVLDQPYSNIDIVCVNDGSTDETLVILQKLSDETGRIVLLNQPNGGVSAARNTGIEYVLNNLSADYIMFLNGDDVWNKDWLSSEIVLILSKGYDSVSFDSCCVDHDLRYRTEYHKPFVGIIEGGDAAVDIDHSIWQGTAFKASLLQKAGIRFHNGQKYGEDLCFLLETRSLSKTCCFYERLVYLYRDRPGSAVRRFIPAIEYYTTLFDGWIQSHQFLKDQGFESKCTYGAIKWYLKDLVQSHFRQNGSRELLESTLQKYSDCLDVDGPEDQKAKLYLEQFSQKYELKQRLIGKLIKIAGIRNRIPLLREMKNRRRYTIPLEQ